MTKAETKSTSNEAREKAMDALLAYLSSNAGLSLGDEDFKAVHAAYTIIMLRK